MTTRTKSAPLILQKKASEYIIIQINQYVRDAKGLKTFKRSKSVLVYNISLDDAHKRILAAMEE